MEPQVVRRPVAGQRELSIIQHHVNYDPVSLSDDVAWRRKPELPSSAELNPDDEAWKHISDELPYNIIDEPWASKNDYLEAHYCLQREEAICGLRYSIRMFKHHPDFDDESVTYVYTKVYIRGYLMSRVDPGPACRIEFMPGREGKRIKWTHTRRLMPGKLVALSTVEDRFKSICIPAVVAARPIRDGLDQNPPTIDIFWANLDDAIMDPNQEYVMLESTSSYYEAIRHSLTGLQHTASGTSPLDKYLVDANQAIDPPAYIAENSRLNVSSLVHRIPEADSLGPTAAEAKRDEIVQPLLQYDILEGFRKDFARYTNLDNSQLAAVSRFLTKEIAIIQGPPGTGKTFTSIQALQVLLQSQPSSESVIIVAAQTNHAVDQLLNHLIKLGYNIGRLGSRTDDPEIQRRTMFELRQKTALRNASTSSGAYRGLRIAYERSVKDIQDLVDQVFPSDLIAPETLNTFGLINEAQYQSFNDNEGWTYEPPEGQPGDVMAEWLGDQLLRVTERSPIWLDDEDSDHGDEEIDPEEFDFDQDDGIVDDDKEKDKLHGAFIPIKHQWTGRNVRSLSEDDIRVRRELNKHDVWEIKHEMRGAIYQFWQRELLQKQLPEFRTKLKENHKIIKNLKVNRWFKDIEIIRTAEINVIGCTTTGLGKYRGLLEALQPRTMLIEEAAETREATVASGIYNSLEHLILVGDHQQLVPQCDSPLLAEHPFNLKVSMFERLVGLNVPYTTLNTQRRMVPTIREILNPFYPHLKDHPFVTEPRARPPVPGTAMESFLFHHEWAEGMDSDASKHNVMEAEMIIGLLKHLMMNGVSSDQITILTFYRGQRKQIVKRVRQELDAFKYHNMKVRTVDSYQGEENDIVILSLVRSNVRHQPFRVGFVENKNRGVVSISRAKRALYIFGNLANLQNATEESWFMWGNVRAVFERQGRFRPGGGFPVRCQNHGTITWMKTPEDWANSHGGCFLKCPENLKCGHPCGRLCHPMSHDVLICQQKCERKLPCGHVCDQVCGKECSCDCSTFTGIYPQDSDLPNEPAVGGAEGFQPLARDSGLVVRTRRSFGGRGRGRGRGVRAGSGALEEMRREIAGPGKYGRVPQFNEGGTAKGHSWASFDPKKHDAQQRLGREAQNNGAKGPETFRETFRSVTIANGQRKRGKSTTSDSSQSLSASPEKIAGHMSLQNSRLNPPITRESNCISHVSKYNHAGFSPASLSQAEVDEREHETTKAKPQNNLEIVAEWELEDIASLSLTGTRGVEDCSEDLIEL